MATVAAVRKELRALSKKRKKLEGQLAAIGELEKAYQVILRHRGAVSRNSAGKSGKLATEPALAAMAIRILRAEKAPLHINDLWKKLEAKGVTSDAKDPLAVLSITLKRHSGRGQPLKKTKRATWAAKQ